MALDPSEWTNAVASLDLPDPLKRSLVALTVSFEALSGGFEALSGAPGPQAPPPPRPASLPEPYEDLGRIGIGGMGEVFRVRDPRLNRTLALKVLHERLASDPGARWRFIEEAQVTAQLQHPGIPPVHDVGTLPDGRPYFAMLEVRGRTLSEAIAEPDARTPQGQRGLVSVVQRAADAVAYAHSRGVIHRDLKPANVMLGLFGEVWVMDWGLVHIDPEARAAPRTIRDEGAFATRQGAVQGTPAFMAPEAARGQPADAASDVYGLGAILHAVLTGRPPHEAPSVPELLQRLAADPPPPTPAGVDEALAATCARALQPDPALRFADAAAFAAELRAYLDGARARDRALALIARADQHSAQAGALQRQALEVEPAAEELPEPTAPEEALWPLWERQDRASALEQEAVLESIQEELDLEAALTHADLPEIRQRLAARHADAHRRAEASGDLASVARHEAYLRAWGGARWQAYLQGRGALSLHTEPPGAHVTLFRFEERHRRLVPILLRELGPAPLQAVPLDRGSYLVELSAPGRQRVRYPVYIERGTHWQGVRPGADAPEPVYLPPEGAVGPGACYVPAGSAIVGRDLPGRPDNHGVERQRVWVDGFVIGRHPITNAQYVAFLDDLADRGEEEALEQLAPRYSGGGRQVWARDAQGHHLLGVDAEGDVWLPDVPVVLVTWEGARAYAAWEAQRSGLPWRLPSELEWAKAARGVDGRPYPWGWRRFDGWTRASSPRWPAPGPVPIDAIGDDVSPYGVCGMAGNVLDWLLDPHPEGYAPIEGGIAVPPREGPAGRRRRVRGGSWVHRVSQCRVDAPRSAFAQGRVDYLGFRLLRPITRGS